MKKFLIVCSLLLSTLLLVACGDAGPKLWTVTFDTGEGGSVIESQEVTNGGKVTKPSDPTTNKEGVVFSGNWLDGTRTWNFDTSIVTKDLTLVAEWTEVSEAPSNVVMRGDAFSQTVTWLQQTADLDAKVYIRNQNQTEFVELEGTIETQEENNYDKASFTPSTEVLGGMYYVKVVSGDKEVTTEDMLLFAGLGTSLNPYLVSKHIDLITLLSDLDYHDKHYLQIEDVLHVLSNPIEINNQRKVEFSGVYNGNNKLLSYTGNGGLFHKITTSGIVRNLTIESTTSVYSSENNLYPIGVIADENSGLIENITTRGTAEDLRLSGDLEAFNSVVDTTNQTTGAAAITGVNKPTGIIKNVTVSGSGVVKAARGVGGVTVYNHGHIESALVTATLPAGNQANTGRSSNAYSYGGGIAAFNFGTITKSTVSGRVFAQSAYSAAGDGNEGKNVVFGGIVGYNEGTISETSFARQMSAKEFIDKSRAEELSDAANNLGVGSIHGDLYIGGIAGINAGHITDVYVGGALVAGRDFVGGVTGLTLNDSTIKNTYVFAEVSIKDDGGNKITAPNTKTTVTTYDIAPSGGYDVNSTVFKRLLNPDDTTWVPGQINTPKLPEFTQVDFETVGNKFTESGVFAWQQGQVDSVEITLEEMVLAHGAIATIEYVVNPSHAPDQTVTWSSGDEDVVEIIGDGEIRGVSAGTAVVTVTTRDGGFTDTITITVESYVQIESATITSPEVTLPQANTSTDRPNIEVGAVFTIEVNILPEDAAYKNFVLRSSNSRASVNGNEVTIEYGNTGPGNVSIFVDFEDSSYPSQEFRFLTVPGEEEQPDTPITSVVITADSITLPNINDQGDRQEILVGTVLTLTFEILPEDASNKNYTIEISNSRASVENHTVTILSTGNVSIRIRFEDTTVGDNGLIEYRFSGIEES